jgi:hypothetical protein
VDGIDYPKDSKLLREELKRIVDDPKRKEGIERALKRFAGLAAAKKRKDSRRRIKAGGSRRP